MISKNEVQQIFERNLRVIKRQVEGLSHADSLLQPPFRGNCMNWILGHMLESRQLCVLLLGQEDFMQADELKRYLYNTEPILQDSEDILHLETLLTLFERSEALLAIGLAETSDEAWETKKVEGDDLIGERIHFVSWHETYHLGQLELLRQLSGKNDKVI